MPETDFAIIILAAGSSSRLGKPKQLLMFKNKFFLQHAIDEASASGIDKIVVVTGANSHDILSSISASKAQFVFNEHWHEGMASSIRAGLSALLSEQPDLGSVIIMLCDQPFVSSTLLQELTTAKQSTDKHIIACTYKETAGVPVLFSSKHFDTLFSLKGAEGAKTIIILHPDDVALIPFPQGAIDIDTSEDYESLIK